MRMCEAKAFDTVFSKVSLSKTVRDTFKNAVVTSFIIYKKEKVIDIKLRLSEIIDECLIDMFKKELTGQLPGLFDILVAVTYSCMFSNCNELVKNDWGNIVHCISGLSPVCKSVISNADWEIEKNNLIIKVKNNMSFYLLSKKVDRLISEKIRKENNLDMHVIFKDDKSSDAQKEEILKEQEIRTADILKAISEKKNSEEAAKQAANDGIILSNIANGVLIGKEFKGEITKIRDAKTEGEKVIIEGSIFNYDKRELKGGKYLVMFNITDFTDSTTVKLFIEPKKFTSEIESKFKTGTYLRVKGDVRYDTYAKEINIMSRDIMLGNPPPEKMDNAEEKRVELHLHTQMSRMDGITPATEYINRALKWGHKAIAITDHGVVQAFPEAMNAADGKDIKVIYGIEAYLIDDLGNAVTRPKGQLIDDEFVVFDIETTGLSKEHDRITEIGAVKVINGKVTDSFSTFVNPEIPIPEGITKLTGITNEMVEDAEPIEKVLPKFIEFFSDSVLVAHNAGFDTGFISKAMERMGLGELQNTYVDTLELAKSLLPKLKKYKLDIVCDALGIDLRGHHRAVNDADATAKMFVKFLDMLSEKNVTKVDDFNVFCSRVVNYSKLKSYHAIILVKNYTGLRNLYELISMSNLEFFKRNPRIPKSKFMQKREGLILGSACEAGELYRAILEDMPSVRIEELVNFYDYLEIQPLGNNMFMVNSPKVDKVNSVDDIKEINKYIVELGKSHNKPVVATCDVHFIDPKDADYRKIIMTAEGFSDAENQPPLYFRTTNEMLKEFEYLGKDTAYEVVVKNTNLIADMIDKIKPIPDGTFPPHFDGANEDLIRITTTRAIELYGDPLPEIVKSRLERELNSIISNGYAVLYIIAQKLVWNSVEHGYLVGSRGSVGSSFVANMAGITEVNSLQPHYRCPNCKYSDFESDIVKKTEAEGGSGFDMPDAVCPRCGHKLKKEGHNIPFETFLGFEGDKEPDIDLNFSGEYQQQAHAYTEVLFGKGKVFKAGTIGTLADKTAYGFVLKYLEKNGKTASSAEIARLANGCTGVKRTTGQHPGGLMIVPTDHDINEFCPVQHPADDVKSNITTTHFDYHSISGRLLKLDLLGHDDPTVIRMLYDLTGVNPQSVELGDEATMSLFESPEALGVKPEDIGCETGTLGIPEFGTKFVRGMLLDTKPKNFSDLLRISGLSHGTNVWLGNAQELIENGTITLQESISTRDSIMLYLISKGLPNKASFKIMEKVRKGKGLTDDDIALMKEHDVPQWYIDSCLKIKYMFPKAHAAAYVMMAFRIAYFKINYPLAYYTAYFTIRACDDFDYSSMCRGIEIAKQAAKEINEKGNSATTKEKNKLTVLEIIIEFYARGFKFYPINLYKSDAKNFIIAEGGLIPPFNSLQGLGLTAAQGIVDGRASGGEFTTIEDFKQRTGLGSTLVELLKENNVLKGIPETNQLTLDF
jgi:DNA polymerase-3 subunit alpha (Gram-positive type)